MTSTLRNHAVLQSYVVNFPCSFLYYSTSYLEEYKNVLGVTKLLQFLSNTQQRKVLYFKGTDSRDFRPVCGSNTLPAGSLVNRLKRFSEIFRFTCILYSRDFRLVFESSTMMTQNFSIWHHSPSLIF